MSSVVSIFQKNTWNHTTETYYCIIIIFISLDYKRHTSRITARSFVVVFRDKNDKKKRFD